MIESQKALASELISDLLFVASMKIIGEVTKTQEILTSLVSIINAKMTLCI